MNRHNYNYSDDRPLSWLKTRLTASFFICLVAAACSKSPIGPELSDKEYTTSASGENGDPNNFSGAPVSCTRSSGHNVYFTGSTISLQYTCEAAVTTIVSTSRPSYLTTSYSGTTVTFSGTGSAATSAASWSFRVNNSATTSASISTQLLAGTVQTASMTSSLSMASTNGTEVDMNFQVNLGSDWDGSFSDAALAASGLSSDMHGLSYSSSCGSGSVYLCSGSSVVAAAANSKNGDLRLSWKYSAFDQGTYHFTITPYSTVEGAVNTLSDVSATVTVPIQTTGGLYTVTHASDASNATYNSITYPYDLAVNTVNSTAVAPIVGGLYFQNPGTHSSFLKRFSIDRQDTPATAPSAVTEASELSQSNAANSTSFHIKALPSGEWLTLGSRSNGALENVYINKVTDGSSVTLTNSLKQLELTSYAGSNTASWVTMSPAFTESSKIYVGLSFVRFDGTDYDLVISKANTSPNSNSKADVIDDLAYNTDPETIYISDGSGYSYSRLKMQTTSESGTQYFYLVYSKINSGSGVQDLQGYKIATSGSGVGNKAASTVQIQSGVWGNNALQNMDLALGTYGGQTAPGIVFNKNNGSAVLSCYFVRTDKNFGNVIGPLLLSSGLCHQPTLHYNSSSGRFIATFSQKNGSGNYDIVSSEITLGSASDTASTPVTIVSTGSTSYPVKLVTDFYQTGNWIPLMYRLTGTDTIVFHGYHVSNQ